MSAPTPPTPLKERRPEPLDAPPTIGETLLAVLTCPRCGHVLPDNAIGKCPTCAAEVSANDTVPAMAATPLPVPDPRDDQGTPFGPYRLLGELGSGGMGRVWKAWDTRLKRVVALKQILSQGAADAVQVERFMREARLAAKLRHPHIVAVHDVGVVDGLHYFVGDFVEGATLGDRLREGVTPRQAATWVKAVAEALAYAHGQGVIHRDVKPGNVLIDAGGVPFVADFGLAKDVDVAGSATRGAPLTLSGYIVGTPQYMSPEQASGRPEAIGAASDQFSLGAVLYELLAGRPPFTGDTLRDVLNAVAELDPAPPSRVSPKVPRDLDTICVRALEKDPARRYPSLAEMASDLGRFLEGEAIHARPATMMESIVRKAVKHRRVVVPVGIAAAVAFGFLGMWLRTALADRREVETKLELGKRFLERGLFQDAKDAFAAARGIDEGNSEARSGYEEANRRQRGRDEAAEAERRRAVAEKEAAEESLRKGGLVQDVLARWLPLSATVEGMETAFYVGPPLWDRIRPSNAEAWACVQAFLDATPGDPTSQATALAFAGWARRLAGYEEEGLGMMTRAQALDAEVPYGYVMEALSRLSYWLAQAPLPGIYLDDKGLRTAVVEDARPGMRHVLYLIDELLDRAAASKVWGQGMAQEFRTALEAVRALQAGRFDEAETGLSRILEVPALRVIRTDLLHMRSYARSYLGKTEEGIEDLRSVLGVRRHDNKMNGSLGVLLVQFAFRQPAKGEQYRKTLEEALQAFDESVRLAPGNAEGYNGRGGVRHKLGDADGALADFQEAVRLAPDEPSRYLNLASQYLDMGRLKEAMETSSRAIDLDPTNPFSYECRGRARSSLGDPKGAEEDYGRAIELDASAVGPRLARAHLRVKRGDLKGALADFDEALELEPANPATLSNRGAMRMNTGDLPGAVADFDEALKLQPDHAGTLYMRAQVKGALGDVPGMRSDLERALDKAPDGWPQRSAAEELLRQVPR